MISDDGSRLKRAVAGVRHLLPPAVRDLIGKTVAAQFDDWERFGPETVAALMATDLWTGRRVNDRAWKRPKSEAMAPEAPRPETPIPVPVPVAPLGDRRRNRP